MSIRVREIVFPSQDSDQFKIIYDLQVEIKGAKVQGCITLPLPVDTGEDPEKLIELGQQALFVLSTGVACELAQPVADQLVKKGVVKESKVAEIVREAG